MWKHEPLQLKSDIFCWNLSVYFTNWPEKGVFFIQAMLDKYICFEKNAGTSIKFILDTLSL